MIWIHASQSITKAHTENTGIQPRENLRKTAAPGEVSVKKPADPDFAA